jgi:hypothetical protein
LSRIFVVLIGLAFAAPSIGFAAAQEGQPAQADNRDRIVMLFDNFFVSLVAAKKCDEPDDRTMKMFVHNLVVVQNMTLRHYKEQLPDRSGGELAEMLNARAEALDRGINREIASKGCTDPNIIGLVDLFDRHARMDFTEGASEP